MSANESPLLAWEWWVRAVDERGKAAGEPPVTARMKSFARASYLVGFLKGLTTEDRVAAMAEIRDDVEAMAAEIGYDSRVRP